MKTSQPWQSIPQLEVWLSAGLQMFTRLWGKPQYVHRPIHTCTYTVCPQKQQWQEKGWKDNRGLAEVFFSKRMQSLKKNKVLVCSCIEYSLYSWRACRRNSTNTKGTSSSIGFMSRCTTDWEHSPRSWRYFLIRAYSCVKIKRLLSLIFLIFFLF